MRTSDDTGVHRTHCCAKHGCKYGDKRCPVEKKKVKQLYPCESCGNGDRFHGGFYEKVKGRLVWHPDIQDIVIRVARQLGPKGKGRLTARTLAQLQFAANSFAKAKQEHGS